MANIASRGISSHGGRQDPAPNTGALLSTECNNVSRTLTADSTTAELACCRRGVTRSMMASASFRLSAWKPASASRMNTCRGVSLRFLLRGS